MSESDDCQQPCSGCGGPTTHPFGAPCDDCWNRTGSTKPKRERTSSLESPAP